MNTLNDELTMQLPLGLALRDDALLSSYYPGDNKEALAYLQRAAQGKGESFIYLWGPQGVGCTHLLQGVCYESTRYQRQAYYYDMARAQQDPPKQLSGFETMNCLCLDNMGANPLSDGWQEALFHMYNKLRDRQQTLIVASHCPPSGLDISLADLKSRLSWGLAFHIKPLNDPQKLAALQLRAQQRGLQLSQDVGWFLLRRCGRRMNDLYDILEKLDKASLAAKRKLTIPFLKEVLDI